MMPTYQPYFFGHKTPNNHFFFLWPYLIVSEIVFKTDKESRTSSEIPPPAPHRTRKASSHPQKQSSVSVHGVEPPIPQNLPRFPSESEESEMKTKPKVNKSKASFEVSYEVRNGFSILSLSYIL